MMPSGNGKMMSYDEFELCVSFFSFEDCVCNFSRRTIGWNTALGCCRSFMKISSF